MDDGDLAAGPDVRVRVTLCNFAVRGPAGVRNTDAAVWAQFVDSDRKAGDAVSASCSASKRNGARAVRDGDPRAVVAPVLKKFQSANKQRGGLVQDLCIPKYSAQRRIPLGDRRGVCALCRGFNLFSVYEWNVHVLSVVSVVDLREHPGNTNHYFGSCVAKRVPTRSMRDTFVQTERPTYS